MHRLRSNKPILALLALLFVVLAAGAAWVLRDGLRPAEARQGPRLLESLPDGNEPAPRTSTLEFLFDQRMDHDAVEAAIQVEPALAYDASWASEGSGERLTLSPQQALAWDTTYRATLGAEATNIAGLPLGRALTVAFTTGREARVLSVQPTPGGAAVGPEQPITVRFDRPLVEVASLEEQEGLPQPVVLSPAVEGIGRWLAPDTFGFYPAAGLTVGTEYEVTISPAVAPGVELAESFEWRFVTEGPRLQATFPFDGASEVSRATTIRLLFNQPMDRESVEGNFQLSADGLPLPVAGQFRWEDEQTLIFVPAEALTTATRYAMEVGEGAKAAGGSRGLASPFRATFATVDFLAVESVQPAAGSRELSTVPTDTVIAVQFNHPVVSLVGAAAQGTLPNPLDVEPRLSGEGEWLTTSLFVLRPAAPLDPSTEYVVTVGSGLQDTVGSFLNEPYSWSFTTEFPHVLRVEPSNPRRHVSPSGPIALRFNQPMARASTEAAFALTASDGSPIAGRIEWDDGARLLRFFPESPLLREARYTLTLAAGAQGARGGATSDAFQTTVVAAPPLRVERTSPRAGENNVEPYRALALTFNTPITMTGLLDSITLVPTATQLYTSYDPDSLTLSLYVEGGFEPSTDYQVTIGTGLRDESGQSLAEPFRLRFQTSPLSPVLELVTPGYGGVGTFNPYTPTLQIVRHRNLNDLRFELFPVTDAQLFQFLGSDGYDALQRFSSSPGQPIATWGTEVDVEPNVSYLYRTLVPAEGRLTSGTFLLRATGSFDPTIPNGPESGQVVATQLMLFTPANLTVKRAPGQLLVWATDLQSGQPLEGLAVELLRADSGGTLGQGRTDADGLLLIDAPTERGSSDPAQTVYALSRGADGVLNGIASPDWSGRVGAWEWGIPANFQPQQLVGTLYTDRPLYRPGQTVYFRGVLRQRDSSALTLPTLRELTLFINDSMGERIFEQPVRLTPFGTFQGQFALGDEAETGPYLISFEQEEVGVCYPSYCYWEAFGANFQVAEYQRPEFEVAATWDQESVVQGEAARASVAAQYFFGGALGEAPYSWRLSAQPYFFEGPTLAGYWTWRDSDADGGDFFRPTFEPTQILREGSGRLDRTGRDTQPLPTTLERGEGVPNSQSLVFEADVRDVNDAIISGRGELVVHAAAFYAGLNPQGFVGNAGQPFTVNVATADVAGALQGNHSLSIEFYQREWYSVQQQMEGGGFLWTSAFTDTLVATRPVTTGADGRATATFTPELGGSYTALARGEDAEGREVRARTFFWITDPGELVTWGRENNDTLELIPDQREYRVGDVARILVPTPFEGMVALVTEEQLDIQSARVVTLTGTAEVLEIPITEAMLPTAYIGVVAVQGITAATPMPEFRVGYATLRVAPDERLLNVAVERVGEGADAPVQPGQDVELRLRVTDAAGAPVQAELSLAIVDKALLSLTDNVQVDVISAYYGERPLAVQSGYSFVTNVDRLSQQFAAQAKGGAGGGGGGCAGFCGPEALRSNFVDTALWRANIVTDERGEALLSFTLPDNLTTWQMSAQGLTGAGEPLVGTATQELLSTLPLLLRPTLPRFFVVGDEADLAVAVHNNSPQSFEATVRFDAEGLSLRDGARGEQRIELPAGARAVLSFPVTVQNVEGARVAITVQGGGLQDGVERAIPVYHLVAPEVVATSGLIRAGEGAAAESILLPDGTEPTVGTLTLEVAPSLAGATQGTLDWLSHYPYASTEAVASAFLPNVATVRALEALEFEQPALRDALDREVTAGVQALLALQNSDGGWGWWGGDASQPWLSGYVLLGLHEAHAAGYSVPDTRRASGIRFLERWLTRTADLQDERTLDTRAFVLYVLSEAGAGDASRAVALFERHSLLGVDGKSFLLLALDNAGAAQRERVNTLASELTANAILSATGAHWEESAPDLLALDSSLRSTALVLRALVRVQPEHLLLPQTVRWLMQARESGHWRSTQESAWAVLSLTDFMAATGELGGDYRYEVALNSAVVLSGAATPDNLAEPVTLTVDVAELLLDEANQLVITRSADDGQSGAGRLYYSAWLRSYQPVEQLEARNEGISVARRYEAVDPTTLASTGAAVSTARAGELLLVRVTVNAPNDLFFFTLEDPIPAGFEILDPTLLTISSQVQGPTRRRVDEAQFNPFWYDGWSQRQVRDEKMVLFSDLLPRGTYEYSYLIRATVPGRYNVMPPFAYQQYHPEVYGRGEGLLVTVEPGEGAP